MKKIIMAISLLLLLVSFAYGQERTCAICGEKIDNSQVEIYISVGIYLTDEAYRHIALSDYPKSKVLGIHYVIVCPDHVLEGFEKAYAGAIEEYNKKADEYDEWYYKNY